jgi:succinyl-CoA--D-citramalate CoA-transferase
MLALRAREVNGGRGQVIDHALYESVLPFLADIPADWVREGRIRTRSGNRHPKVAPGGCYLSGEGHWFLLSATSDASYRRLMAALGLEREATDPRFQTNHLRVQNREALDALIDAAMGRLTDAEVEAAFARHDVAASPVQDVQQVYEHPQVRARGDFVQLDDPLLGPLPVARPTPHLLLTPGRVQASGPAVGEHNRDVYGALLGYSAERLEELQRDGTI